jgi:hypothetical protein
MGEDGIAFASRGCNVTPSEWDEAMHQDVHWRDAYLKIEQEVRAVLESEAPERGDRDMWSVAELVERLYPRGASQSVVSAGCRQRIFDGLNAMSKNVLGDCCVRASVPIQSERFGLIYPWMWHRPAGELNEEAKAREGEKTRMGLSRDPRH